jgi:polyisoprenoid-binding protein YceI
MKPPDSSHNTRPLQWLAAVAMLAALAVPLAIATVPGTDGPLELKFVATQAEVPISGRFTSVKADIGFDPARPSPGSVRIIIDTGSVATGSADADTLLKGQDFFDSAHFPQATFISNSIAAQGAAKLTANGRFTLKGHESSMVISLASRQEDTGWRLEGSVPVSRLAFEVGKGEWADTGTLADTVVISFRLFIPR